MSYKTTVVVGDLEFEVEFNATPIRHATFHEPAEGGEVEIEGIYFEGIEMMEYLHPNVVKRCEEVAEERASDCMYEEAACAGEDEAERRAEDAMCHD